jgi:threonine/homoserine efflux transporter RhtA
MTIESMSREEIEAFACKLDDFEAALLPRELAYLRTLLMRAAGDQIEDVEAHGLAHASIAGLVFAVAGSLGVANATSGSSHHTMSTATHVHHVVSVVGDEKGGSVRIVYTTDEGSGSR